MIVISIVLACPLQRPADRSNDPQRNEPPRTRPNDFPQQPSTERPQQEQPPLQPPPNFPPQQPSDKDGIGDNGNPSILNGAWRINYQMGGTPCTAESIFENTGTYSTLATCDDGFGGSYMTRSVGDWKLIQPGMIRIQYTDHEPKEFGGRPIRYPDGETVNFTVRDSDHLVTSLGIWTREF